MLSFPVGWAVMVFPPTRGHYYDKDDIMYTVFMLQD